MTPLLTRIHRTTHPLEKQNIKFLLQVTEREDGTFDPILYTLLAPMVFNETTWEWNITYVGHNGVATKEIIFLFEDSPSKTVFYSLTFPPNSIHYILETK